MRTEQPKMIYLKDYQAPDYLIDETNLTFELYEDHTLVHAQLVMRRNPARGCTIRRRCPKRRYSSTKWNRSGCRPC